MDCAEVVLFIIINFFLKFVGFFYICLQFIYELLKTFLKDKFVVTRNRGRVIFAART